MIDLNFIDQNALHRLTITELSKKIAIAFSRNLHLLEPNPLFPMQRHLGLFWSFSDTVSTTQSKKHLIYQLNILTKKKKGKKSPKFYQEQ